MAPISTATVVKKSTAEPGDSSGCSKNRKSVNVVAGVESNIMNALQLVDVLLLCGSSSSRGGREFVLPRKLRSIFI